jgi:hypothetical protein
MEVVIVVGGDRGGDGGGGSGDEGGDRGWWRRRWKWQLWRWKLQLQWRREYKMERRKQWWRSALTCNLLFLIVDAA